MYTFQQLLPLTNGMEFPLGFDTNNNFRKENLSELNHLLISGASGFGKSSFLDSVVLSLIAHNNPSQLRFVMCDTKASEFSQYADAEHLLMPIATNLRDISVALGLVLSQGRERLRTFAGSKVKNISSFNDIAWENYEEELPRIVVLVDDLSAIVNPPSQARNAYAYIVERIEEILSIGRAAGIHLIAVTQTPAKKRMKNLSSLFLSKVVFCSPSPTDLRLLTGAKTPGLRAVPGEALFCNVKTCELVHTLLPQQTDFSSILGTAPDLIDKAAEIAVEKGTISEANLQKKLGIGRNQSSNLLFQLEEMGLIGPPDDFGNRKTLISKEQWDIAMEQIENE